MRNALAVPVSVGHRRCEGSCPPHDHVQRHGLPEPLELCGPHAHWRRRATKTPISTAAQTNHAPPSTARLRRVCARRSSGRSVDANMWTSLRLRVACSEASPTWALRAARSWTSRLLKNARPPRGERSPPGDRGNQAVNFHGEPAARRCRLGVRDSGIDASEVRHLTPLLAAGQACRATRSVVHSPVRRAHSSGG